MATLLSDGVWCLDLGIANAALVDDGGTVTLVDAGTAGGTETLLDEIEATDHAIGDVGRILVTHYDGDHVGGLPLFDEQDGEIVAGDAALVRGETKPSLRHWKGLMQRVLGWRVDPPTAAVSGGQEGDVVGGFEVFETPGHTPNHVAYVHADRSVVLLGDLVRSTDDGFAVPPRLLNHDTGRVAESIVELVDRMPSVEAAVVGHGSPVTDGAADRLRQLADELR